MIRFFIFALVVILPYASYAACLRYTAPATLQGIFERHTYPEQPNYTSIQKGDHPATYWILKLDKPVCFSSGVSDNVTENNISEMQMAFKTHQDYATYSNLLDKPVKVSGTFFHAVTGHHHTKILMDVMAVTPASGK